MKAEIFVRHPVWSFISTTPSSPASSSLEVDHSETIRPNVTRDGSPFQNMSPSGQRVIHSWNPAEVLELANPDKCSASKWSCPAQTSKKTRCLKTRDASSYTDATHLLNEMSIIDPVTFLDNNDMLVKLAKLTLCAANHLQQYRELPGSGKPISNVDLVVTRWVALISAYIAKNDDSKKPASSADPLSLKSDLHEEQGHQNSTWAVVDEALSATDSQSVSQHRLSADIPIKVEGHEGKSPRVSL